MGKGELVGSCRLHELAIGTLDNIIVWNRLMFGCLVACGKEVVAGTRVDGGVTDGGNLQGVNGQDYFCITSDKIR